MTGLELFVWESHSDLYGAPVPMESIVNELKQFSCPSVLFLCSYISLRLQLGGWGDGFDETDYIALLSKMFSKETAEYLIDRLSSKIPRRRVFHRRLLLLVAKLAIIHCDFDGRDAAKEPDAFGHMYGLAYTCHEGVCERPLRPDPCPQLAHVRVDPSNTQRAPRFRRH